MLLQAMMIITVLIALAAVGTSESMLIVHTERAQVLASTLNDVAASAIEDARVLVAKRVADPAEVDAAVTPAPIQTTLPLCGIAQTGCTVGIAENFALTPDQPLSEDDAITPAPCPANAAQTPDNAVCNLQNGGDLHEGRTTVAITITLLDPNGAALAQTNRMVRMRTFASAPYAIVVGVMLPHGTGQENVVADLAGIIAPVSPTPAVPETPAPQGTMVLVAMEPVGGGLPQPIYVYETPQPSATPTPAFTPSGANASPGVAVDTLIRSYAPCRASAANAVDGATFNNWEGTQGTNTDIVTCEPNAGDTSQFRDETVPAPSPTANWSM